DTIEVNPLAPEKWEYFALDDVMYRGHRLSILWDKNGRRYGRGKGLHVLVDGEEVASAESLRRLRAKLPERSDASAKQQAVELNYAVNNEGRYYPQAIASF